MPNLLGRAARALSFSHLAAIPSSARSKAKADDDDKRDDETEEEYEKRKKKEKEDKEGDDESASGGGSGAGAEKGDDEDEGDDKSSKGKKGKADDSGESEDAEDDDKDEEMRGNGVAAAARRRERGRCAAIFASRYAARNPQLAAELAFNTSMPRSEALAVLRGTPAPSASGERSDRSARNPDIGAGAADRGNAPSAQQRWDRAFQKATPRKS